MSKHPIKVITFDLDDTLWDVQPTLNAAEHCVYQWLRQYAPLLVEQFSLQQLIDWRHRVYLQQPDLAHQISQLRITALQLAMEHSGYSQNRSIELATGAFAIFLDARHQVTLFDSVLPLLEQLQNQYRLGILTNGNADVFRLELGQYFEFAYRAEQLNASKPAADHFLAAQAFSQCQPQQMIHIGDHIDHDVTAAIDAGWHAIWFNPERNQANVHTTAALQVQCLTEIPAAISTLEHQLLNL